MEPEAIVKDLRRRVLQSDLRGLSEAPQLVEDVGNNANTYLLVSWSGMASLASALFGGVGIAKFVKERETVGYLVDGASV